MPGHDVAQQAVFVARPAIDGHDLQCLFKTRVEPGQIGQLGEMLPIGVDD
jgi:hypothetical protein